MFQNINFQIWNHPDVLYNFLRKRSEVNAAIEEDIDLEELGGVAKAGRPLNKNGKPRGKPGPKPRVRTEYYYNGHKFESIQSQISLFCIVTKRNG